MRRHSLSLRLAVRRRPQLGRSPPTASTPVSGKSAFCGTRQAPKTKRCTSELYEKDLPISATSKAETLCWRIASRRKNRSGLSASRPNWFSSSLTCWSQYHVQPRWAPSAQPATIPIVFSLVPDPVGDKLVKSLSRPGGNITGLSNMALDLSAKRIELLKDMVVGLSRVALLVNGGDPEGARRYIEQSQAAAAPLGITIEPVEVQGIGDIPRAFSKIDQLKVNGLVGTADSLFTVERKNIIQLAIERRLPTMMHSKETTQAGALMSYAPSYVLIMRRTAIYVDKIIKGAIPADLPVEQPTTFELVISLKTAAALGLTVPPTLLAHADEVIE